MDKYRLVASHLHQTYSTTMQAAARTNIITNTATPASRPESVDDLVPAGSVDGQASGSMGVLSPSTHIQNNFFF